MARIPDLVKFAQLHGLKIATIADLISYRRRNERLVDLVAVSKINSRFGGEFDMRVYRNKIGSVEHIALIRGNISGDEPVLVRMHQSNIFADGLGDTTPGAFFGGAPRARGGELEASMRVIAKANRGVVVLMRDPNENFMSRALAEREGHAPRQPIEVLRQFGIGAQILLDIGVRNLVLLTNSQQKVVGLEGYGLHIERQQAIPDSVET